MRDFETIVDCIYRDVNILNRIFIRCPIYPRQDMWRCVELLLDAASIAERLALGIDSYGEVHEKTSKADTLKVSENCNE